VPVLRTPVVALRPAVIAAIALVGVVLNTGSLSLGLLADDFLHLVIIVARLAGRSTFGHWWEIFGVPTERSVPVADLIGIGVLPWWSSPAYSTAFFRPFAALLHYGDYLLWPTRFDLMHAHNLAWYGLLIALVALCYRRLTDSTGVAALASLFYALDDAHAEGVAWLAGRNTVVSACCCAAALLAHDYARRDGSRRGAWSAPLFTGLGLAAGEGGAAVWGLLLAHAACIDPTPLRARVRALVPHLIVTVVWLAMYRMLGYGARGGGFYIDPLHSPLAFSMHLPMRFASGLLELLTVPGSIYAVLSAPWVTVTRAASIVFVVVLLWYSIRVARSNRNTAFWLLSMLLSILPFCGVVSGARLLFTPGMGAFVLLAAPVMQASAWLTLRVRRMSAPMSGLLVLAVLIVIVHGVGAAVVSSLRAPQLRQISRDLGKLAASIPVTRADAPSATVFVLNTPDFMTTASTPVLRALENYPVSAFYHLGACVRPVTLTRVSRTVFELAPEDGYLAEITSTFVRDPKERFTLGAHWQLGPAQLHVVQLTPDGRPARVLIELENPDDPRWIWLYWRGPTEGFRVAPLPAIGASILLTSEPIPPRPEVSLWL
jgi:hypothetical protein